MTYKLKRCFKCGKINTFIHNYCMNCEKSNPLVDILLKKYEEEKEQQKEKVRYKDRFRKLRNRNLMRAMQKSLKVL